MSDIGTSMSGRRPGAVDAAPVGLVQARLRLALEAAQMGLWDWDVVTGRLVWDERSAAMFGTTLAESTGSMADVDARVHPQDLPRVRAELSGALESLGAVDVEFRVVWPDGSVRWLYGRGQALVDERGVAVRLLGVNADITEQRHATRERGADLARMAALVAVAQRLGDADSEAQVLAVVTEHGAALLGVQGAVLVLTDPDAQQVRSLTTTGFLRQEEIENELAVLPFGFPLPMVDTAQTGTAHFLPDRAAAVALFPGGAEAYRRAGTQGSASVPLRARGAVFGALAVAFTGRHDWRPADRELLEALAALAGQALDRILAQRAEREATRASRRLSETLQRSLLTAPPQPNHLQIAALPARRPRHPGRRGLVRRVRHRERQHDAGGR